MSALFLRSAKSGSQQRVTLTKDEKRTNSCQHQYKNNQKELHLDLLWGGNAVARI